MEEAQQVAEAISPQVNQLIERVLGYLEQGMTVAEQQAPLLVEEILRWGVWCGVPSIILGVLIPIGWAGICKATWVYNPPKDYERADYIAKTVISGLVCSVCAGVLMFYGVAKIAKVLIAPRLYLIEYLKDLM